MVGESAYPKMSVEEYLSLNENDPEHRYEYVDGEVYMRPSEHIRHSIIGVHVGSILGNALKDDPRAIYNSQAWIKLSNTRYIYPDVTVSSKPWNDNDEEDAEMVQSPCLLVTVSADLFLEKVARM